MIEVYKACVENLRELKSQQKSLKRLFNKSIVDNDKSSLCTLTKLYALLYSSFAELSFLKVIHTPYGFNESEINQISSESSLDKKWKRCVELAFRMMENGSNAGEIQNKKRRLQGYIETYIIEPSQLRNKIAHGQWKIALNGSNTGINHNMTQRINDLDFVKIDILFNVYLKLGQAIEDLIESPQKAHFNYFYTYLTELDEFILKTQAWNLESKINQLKDKAAKKRHLLTESKSRV